MRALAWFLGLFALGLASIAVFSYPVWQWLHPHFDFPFHRMGERIGMLVLLIAFIGVAPRLRLADRRSLGYGLPRRRFWREAALGLVLGVITMGAIVAIMTALGLLDWSTAAHLAPGALIKIVLARFASGIAVGLIEETFLRGAMHTAIERESGPTAAVLLTAVLYAATHFLASYRIPADAVTSSSGLALLAGTLHAFARPFDIADAFLCLTVVGVVLGCVRVATGNIAACIGLHAGWVWVMLVAHEMTHPVVGAPLGFLVSRFDGFIGWLVLAWTALMGLVLQRYYTARTLHLRT